MQSLSILSFNQSIQWYIITKTIKTNSFLILKNTQDQPIYSSINLNTLHYSKSIINFKTNSKIISFEKTKYFFTEEKQKKKKQLPLETQVTYTKNPMNIFLALDARRIIPSYRRTFPIEYELGRSVRKLARYSLMTRKGIFWLSSTPYVHEFAITRALITCDSLNRSWLLKKLERAPDAVPPITPDEWLLPPWIITIRLDGEPRTCSKCNLSFDPSRRNASVP